jgi:hypothetical protein
VVGYDELAAEITKENPNYNEALVKAVMVALNQKIQENLIHGNQVTLENAFSYRLSFTARLNEIDDPLPKAENLVQVKISPSHPFVASLRNSVKLEKLPPSEKLPLMESKEDTRLKLNDVLYAKGVLKIIGNHLFFDHEHNGGECIIEGTRSGKTTQLQFALISNSTILVVPDIPEPEAPWNNEYTLSVTTHYTDNGTLRTGAYKRFLRTPLSVTGVGDTEPIEVGLLTGSASSPYVTITGGALTANEMLRIQVILDLSEGHLLFNLLDMTENGKAGDVVKVTANGAYSLTGFADSALTRLDVTVNDFTPLVKMLRSSYSGRLVDILDIQL